MPRYFILCLCLLLLCGCGLSADGDAALPQTQMPEVAQGAEVFCLAQTQAEAEAIAEQYGIQLVSFEAGVAVFHTQGDWQQLMEEGKQQGWAELSPNFVTEIDQQG